MPPAIQQHKPLLPALALVYWAHYHPRLIGYTAAVATGVLLDLANQTPLGFHAVSCSVVVFGAFLFERRFALFGGVGQGAHVFLILAAGQMTGWALGGLEAGELAELPGWRFFIPSISAGVLWLALPLIMRKLLRLVSK